MKNDYQAYAEVIANSLEKVLQTIVEDADGHHKGVSSPVSIASTSLIAIRLHVQAMLNSIDKLTLEEFKERYVHTD